MIPMSVTVRGRQAPSPEPLGLGAWGLGSGERVEPPRRRSGSGVPKLQAPNPKPLASRLAFYIAAFLALGGPGLCADPVGAGFKPALATVIAPLRL